MVASKVSSFKNSAGKTVVVTFADVGLVNPTIAERAKAKNDIRDTRRRAKDGDAKAQEQMAAFADRSMDRQMGRAEKNVKNKPPTKEESIAKERKATEKAAEILTQKEIKAKAAADNAKFKAKQKADDKFYKNRESKITAMNALSDAGNKTTPADITSWKVATTTKADRPGNIERVATMTKEGFLIKKGQNYSLTKKGKKYFDIFEAPTSADGPVSTMRR